MPRVLVSVIPGSVAFIATVTTIATVTCSGVGAFGGAASAAVPTTVAASAAADLPPVFDTRPYAEAKAAAEAADKWFIVKGTAVWCAPCKQMDRTTWRDEKVVAWCKEHAIVVALDVDQQKSLARELRIEGMPTMIAFKNGEKEFDRIVGMRRPAEFLAWLEAIDRGETSMATIARKAGERPAPGARVDVAARLELAQALAMNAEYAKATDEFAWLWQHMLEHDPGMVGVRVSSVAMSIARLVAKDQGARTRFNEIRAATRARIAGEKVDPRDVADLIALNGMLGEPQETLRWFDEVKADPRMTPALQASANALREPLLAEQRWSDVGRLLGDPVADLRRTWTMFDDSRTAQSGIDPEMLKALREQSTLMLRDNAGQTYAALLAANRDADASAFLDAATKLDPSAAMIRSLIATAITAGVAQETHQTLLDEAAAKHPDLADLKGPLNEAIKQAPRKTP
jgi:thiol-disulfide isomerase/thioredoxin